MSHDETWIGEMLLRRRNIKDLESIETGNNVVVAGWIKKIKKVGKRLIFIIVSDITGDVQLTAKDERALETRSLKLTRHTFVLAKGKLRRGLSKKMDEILLERLCILGERAVPLPIDVDEEKTSLSKSLDYRWLSLRNRKRVFPLLLLSDFMKYSREFFYKENFVEIFTPKLMSAPSESGAEVFEVAYFDRKAYLAQSPQFYKQMAICSGFERVFEIGPVFRANPSFTSRHDTEFTSLDVEMAYIPSHHFIMDFEEKWLAYVLKKIADEHGDRIEREYGCIVQVPKRIPRIKMEEVYEIVTKECIRDNGDLRPEGERQLSKYVKETYDSDFVFVVDYPYSARPFYHMKGDRMKDGRETTKSFDLIYRGVEITTGAQREHRYRTLVKQAIEKGLNIENLKFYLEFFKYGAPPHGGFGFGPTRFIMQLLDLKDVRRATFIPRDPSRLLP